MEANTSTPAYSPRTAANAGAILTLVDPDGVATTKKLHLRGADSDAYREKMHEIHRRNTSAIERSKKIRMPPPEQLEADAIELTVAATVGWEGFDEKVFSADLVRALYVERPDYKEQADAFVNDRASFFKRAASA